MKREVMNDEYRSLDRARLGLEFLNGRLEMYQIREIDQDKILWRELVMYMLILLYDSIISKWRNYWIESFKISNKWDSFVGSLKNNS